MDVDSLILILIVLASGFIPPGLLLTLERILAKKSLKQMEAIRDQAFDQADAYQRNMMDEIVCLKTWVQNHLDQYEVRMNTRIAEFEKHTRQDLADLKISAAKIDGAIADIAEFRDEFTSFKGSLDSHLCSVIDGKIGSEIKEAKNELLEDPEMQEAYIDYRTSDGGVDKVKKEGRMLKLMKGKVINHFEKKLLNW